MTTNSQQVVGDMHGDMHGDMRGARRAVLFALFFASGVAALVYQIAWQRMLYALFGVDLESVTVIVSVFMFGLGVGALLGGQVADRLPGRLLAIFAVVELGIGAYGFMSAQLIEAAGLALAGGGRELTALASFSILAVPTILMGATLPILVAHVNATDRHVGSAVGMLYYANTLGATVGAALAGFVLLQEFGLLGSVRAAALLNSTVALVATIAFRRPR